MKACSAACRRAGIHDFVVARRKGRKRKRFDDSDYGLATQLQEQRASLVVAWCIRRNTPGFVNDIIYRYEVIAAAVDSGESESIRPFCYG